MKAKSRNARKGSFPANSHIFLLSWLEGTRKQALTGPVKGLIRSYDTGTPV